MTQVNPGDRMAAMRANLAAALTFHASFDHGPDADFALGDKRIYTASEAADKTVTLHLGLGEPPLQLEAGAGKFGAALAFTAANTHPVQYKAAQNVAYSATNFQGTISFWMRLDPAEIPVQYCDPLQVTDKDFSDAAIWVDFTKNDKPSDFRLGFFGNQPEWDVNNRRGDGIEFYWRLLKIVEPPFRKDEWTHVVISWAGVNSPERGRARLYLNGEYAGATGGIHEQFTWDVNQVHLRLGIGEFIGWIDDLACFNRALVPDEVRVLYGLEQGVAALYAQ